MCKFRIGIRAFFIPFSPGIFRKAAIFKWQVPGKTGERKKNAGIRRIFKTYSGIMAVGILEAYPVNQVNTGLFIDIIGKSDRIFADYFRHYIIERCPELLFLCILADSKQRADYWQEYRYNALQSHLTGLRGYEISKV
jgi:hypothetical protein